MTEKPKVSIVVIPHVRSDTFKDLLKALEENTSESHELVLVANAPSAEVRSLCRSHADRHSNCVLIVNKENKSFSYCNNQGAKKAKAELLCFLNDDVVPGKRWLAEMLKTMEEKKAGIVGAKLLYEYGALQHIGGMVRPNIRLGFFLLPRPSLLKTFEMSPELAFRGFPANVVAKIVGQDTEVPWVNAACMLVPKKSFFEVGGFDTGYFFGFEDIDLCFKLREKGFPVWVSEKSASIHHESASIGSGPLRVSSETYAKNNKLFKRKWAWKLFMNAFPISKGWKAYKRINKALLSGSPDYASLRKEAQLLWKGF